MKFMKKSALWVAMLLVTLGVVEAMARLAYYMVYGEFAVHLTAAEAGDVRAWERDALRHRAADMQEVPHPFYGFVVGWPERGLNGPPPRRGSAGEWVVALLGGSVAVDVAGELRNALLRHFLDLGTGVAPIFVDLANSGYHQPQQAIALANMLANGGQFDAVVVLDGYNEITGSPAQAWRGLAPSFPSHWQSMAAVTTDQWAIIGRIGMLRDEQENLLRVGQRAFLRRSAVFGLIWRLRFDRIERLIRLQHHELAATGATGKGGSVRHNLEKQGPLGNRREGNIRVRELGVKFWHESALLLAGLAKRHGMEYYHFLQPNRHLPDSKPLSDEELAMSPRHSVDMSPEMVTKLYPLLSERGRRLREQGVGFFDLSSIFKGRRETLYVDFCCHLNKRGNELLADGMVRRILGGSRLAERRGSLTPIGRGAFDVYHLGTYLAYARAPCLPEDAVPNFFLHVVPVFEEDMPSSHSKNGFENLDFSFAQAGTVFGDRCVATVPLPHYSIARIRTGQIGIDEPIWEVDFAPSS